MGEKSSKDNSNIEEPSSFRDEMRIESTKNLLTSNTVAVFYPYIPILLVILIFSRREGYSGYRGASDTPFKDTAFSMQKVMKNPDIKIALQSVCEHLDEEEQIPIHTLAGVLQTMNTIQKLLDNSYKIQGLSYSTSSSKIEKQLGIISILETEYFFYQDKY